MHFGGLVGGFLDRFGVMLSSETVLDALWELCLCRKPISTVRPTPFWRILGSFWEGFWIYFCIFFGYRFWNRFSFAFALILIHFHTLRTSKSEQIRWEVLQKSNFRIVCYRMCLEIDFGRILGVGWRQFWVPMGVQKRLGKDVLQSMQMRRGRNWITTLPHPLNFPVPGPQWEGSGRESLTRRATPQRGVGGYEGTLRGGARGAENQSFLRPWV